MLNTWTQIVLMQAECIWELELQLIVAKKELI